MLIIKQFTPFENFNYKYRIAINGVLVNGNRVRRQGMEESKWIKVIFCEGVL